KWRAASRKLFTFRETQATSYPTTRHSPTELFTSEDGRRADDDALLLRHAGTGGHLNVEAAVARRLNGPGNRHLALPGLHLDRLFSVAPFELQTAVRRQLQRDFL